MGVVYILRLEQGKWYVGWTNRNIERIWEHVEGDGAKWTQRYPPVEGREVFYMQDGHKPPDENRITLETMKKHGIRNVRGGDWCMVKMRKKTYRELEALIGKPKSGEKCGRCGRSGHARSKCYATTTVDGVAITTKSWKYRPKAKAKPKKSEYRTWSQCEAMTDVGSRCQIGKAEGSRVCHVHKRLRVRPRKW
tara:strand:- start:44 stop:622 length:579 start_codon:yes stop_codon:yes gene_type:complete